MVRWPNNMPNPQWEACRITFHLMRESLFSQQQRWRLLPTWKDPLPNEPSVKMKNPSKREKVNTDHYHGEVGLKKRSLLTWSFRNKILELDVSSIFSLATLAAITSSRYRSNSNCIPCNIKPAFFIIKKNCVARRGVHWRVLWGGEGGACPGMNPDLELPQRAAHPCYDGHRTLNCAWRWVVGTKEHFSSFFPWCWWRQPQIMEYSRDIDR